MAVTVKSLYDIDFVEWTSRMAEMLRSGRLDEAEVEHLAEEIEDLGKRDRSAVRSQLGRMLVHLVKQKVQPERDGSSWRRSIVDARRKIRSRVQESPSLRNHLQGELPRIYRDAVRDAMYEMQLPASRAAEIPSECPYTLEQLLDEPLQSSD